MMYRVLVLATFVIAVWLSPALSQAGKPAAPAAAAAQAAAASAQGAAPTQAAAAPAPQDDPPPVLAVPKEYKYDARGRRDPFVNPVPKPAAAAAAVPVVRPPGLKGVLIAEASIGGVVTSREPSMNVVIINAPAGKSYFARVGDELYDASVKEIRLDTVTFALNSPAVNSTAPREVVRKVRPAPGE